MAANTPLMIRWGSDISAVIEDTEKIKLSISDTGSRIATAMKVGAFGAATAVAGFGVASVKMFGDFEQGMNEVRTLLPEIGEEGFGKLQEDVIAFSKEMGVATDDAIPALYQAISAGVPVGSVFDFMTTASKAAIGGVTDLETAVDGITTVVNGYGEENLSAKRAADLMFTAVKLGKTDFEQLSASLSNVTPMAAALGVGFDEVTAAMAVMTAQGVPTSVATTAIRSALAELGKAGSQAGDKFLEISGTTFPEFVREGGSLGEALTALKVHVDENNLELQNMFSSVEAGTGALAILSDDGNKYADALDEMAESAGAADSAFATMDSGVNRSTTKLKTQLETLKVQVGAALVPPLSTAVESMSPHVDTVLGWFGEDGPLRRALTKTGEVGGTIWDKLLEVSDGIWDKVGQPVFDEVEPFVTETLPSWYNTVVDKVNEWAGHAWEKVGQPLFDDYVKPFITETLPSWYNTVVDKVNEWAGHAWDKVGKPLFDNEVKPFLTETVPRWYDNILAKAREWNLVPGGKVEDADRKFGVEDDSWGKTYDRRMEDNSNFLDKIAPAFDWVGPAMDAIGGSLIGLVSDGGGVHTLIESFGNFGSALVDLAADLAELGKVLGTVIGLVALAFAPALRGVAMGAIQAVSGVLNVLGGIISIISGLVLGDWTMAWNGVKDVFKGLGEILLAPFTGLWESLKGIMDGLIGDLVLKAFEMGVRFVLSLWDAIKWLIEEAPGKILDWIVDIGLGIGDLVLKGLELGADLGGALMDGIVNFIKDAPGAILDALIAIVPSPGDIVGAITGKLSGAAKGLVDWVGGDGGIVTKPTFAMIGEAGTEAVLPLEGSAAKGWLGTVGAAGRPTTTINVNVQGDVYSGPDHFAEKVTTALRRAERVHGQISDFSAV